jgi:dUTP pyrophosphatase
MKIQVTRIDKDLPLPSYQTEGAVAFDLAPRATETIAPRELKILPANIIIKIPEGYMLLIASRSSTARKKGLMLANGVGVLDQDYHGPKDELGILVYNFTDAPVTVERGERIAQGIIVPIHRAEFEEVEVVKEESRGGFGSTG